jgi:hypothetical protein
VALNTWLLDKTIKNNSQSVPVYQMPLLPPAPVEVESGSP